MGTDICDLVRACKSGNLNAIRQLQATGPNETATSPGDLSCIHWLILGVSTTDETCVEILELLSPKDVNVTSDNLTLPGFSQIQRVSGVTPLHLAVFYKGVSVIRKLIDLGGNPDVQDSNGDTCLIYAAREGSIEKIEALLDAGANLQISNNAGETAMTLVSSDSIRESMIRKLNDQLVKAIKGKRDITSLINARADPSFIASDGTPCLCLAIQAGDYANILQLLEQSPQVDSQTLSGNTAIHEAIMSKMPPTEQTEIISELIFLKADVNGCNASGKTALDLANEFKCDESLIKLLTDNDAQPSLKPVTIAGKIVRQQSSSTQPIGGPPSPSGDVSPRAPDTIDLSEVAGRAGSLLAELAKARQYVGTMDKKGNVVVSQTMSPQLTLSDLEGEKNELEKKLSNLTTKFDGMKSKNKNISDFRSIGEFLELQKTIAECRNRIGQISHTIEKGDYATTETKPTTNMETSSTTMAALSTGWFRSPDSIESDIEQCIRTIRKSTNNSINMESAIYEFVKKASPGGGLVTSQGIPILKLLRNRGSEINWKNKELLITPFAMLCDGPFAPDDETVDWMLSNGVDLTATAGFKNWTCLFYAAHRGHLRVCEKILKRAAKSKLATFAGLRDTDGKTAYDYTAHQGVLKLLQESTQDQPDVVAGS